jgi:5-hydroxyisourate hydrolase
MESKKRGPSISTHVLDQEQGLPGRGCSVTLSRWEDGRLVQLAAAVTDQDGRAEGLAGDDVRAGVYRLTFDVAGYLRRHGREAPFLQTVVIDFQIADTQRHHHVPLLLSPYSCTTYRGS